MQGIMGLIKIGGRTEIERNEIRDKIVDGLNALRNAALGGVVPGGGSSLVHASKILDLVKLSCPDEQAGVLIFKNAIQKPFVQLIDNSGQNGAFYLHKLLQEEDLWTGYSLKSDSFVNMLEEGIIDSQKNIIGLLNDSASIGSILLTTEVMISNTKAYFPKPLKEYPKDAF
jgi:chaperonin GroEL